MKPADDSSARRRLRITPHVAATLIFWRKVRRMRQEDLARASGVSLSTIKWLERGRKCGPRTNTLEDICDALGITLMELFSGAQRRALEGACER